MTALLLIICICTNSVQSIFKKQYNRKTDRGTFIFNTLSVFSAMLFFAVPAVYKGFLCSPALIGYAAGFAAAYAIAAIAGFLAISWGAFGITSLVFSYSLVIPTLYGLIFLGEPLTFFKCAGICALLLPLYLVRSAEQSGIRKVSFK